MKNNNIAENINKKNKISLPKNKITYNLNDLKTKNFKKDYENLFDNQNNNPKLRKNKTHKIEFPKLRIIKNNLENLILKIDELNTDFEKKKIKHGLVVVIYPPCRLRLPPQRHRLFGA